MAMIDQTKPLRNLMEIIADMEKGFAIGWQATNRFYSWLSATPPMQVNFAGEDMLTWRSPMSVKEVSDAAVYAFGQLEVSAVIMIGGVIENYLRNLCRALPEGHVVDESWFNYVAAGELMQIRLRDCFRAVEIEKLFGVRKVFMGAGSGEAAISRDMVLAYFQDARLFACDVDLAFQIQHPSVRL